MIEVILSVVAAGAYALGSVLQRRGTISAPGRGGLRLGLVVDLLRRPAWLVGIAAMIIGVVLQAIALHGGAIALVEPILVVELPLTLVFAALIFRARVDRRTGGTMVVMSAALAMLLVLARPSGGHVEGVSVLAWMLSVAAVAGLIVARWSCPKALARVGHAGTGLRRGVR